MSNWITLECNGAPHCRHENGFAAYKGKFYLFGGRRIQPVDIFDPDTNTWTHGAPPPKEMHHFQPVIVGHQIWLLGTMTGCFPAKHRLKRCSSMTPRRIAGWKGRPYRPRAVAVRRLGAPVKNLSHSRSF